MKVIYNRFIPFGGFAAMNLFGLVLAREEAKPLSRRTLNHEAIHTAQMRELLYAGFYLWYIVEWLIKLFIYGKNAYQNISFEREAYRHAGDDNYPAERKSYAWLKLITHNL